MSIQSLYSGYKSGYTLISRIHNHPYGNEYRPSPNDYKSRAASKVNFPFVIYDITKKMKLVYDSNTVLSESAVNTYKDLYEK